MMKAQQVMFQEQFRFLPIVVLGIIILVIGNGCVTSPADGIKSVETVKVDVPAKKVDKAGKLKEFEQGSFLPTSNKFEIFPLSRAYSVYRSSKYKPTGVYVHSGIVFVIVNIDTAQKKHRRTAKGHAMLRSQEMLRKYFSLPQKFSFENRQLESTQYYSKKFFRYSLAYSLEDIKNYTNEHAQK